MVIDCGSYLLIILTIILFFLSSETWLDDLQVLLTIVDVWLYNMPGLASISHFLENIDKWLRWSIFFYQMHEFCHVIRKIKWQSILQYFRFWIVSVKKYSLKSLQKLLDWSRSHIKRHYLMRVVCNLRAYSHLWEFTLRHVDWISSISIILSCFA